MRLSSMMLRVTAALMLTFALGACAANADDSTGGSNDALTHATDGGAAPTGLRIRLANGNISSGNNQSYDPGDGIRILKGLAIDVAMIQELNYGSNTDADYKSFVAQAFDSSYSYAIESGAQIPNGIVSRYPIKSSGKWVDPSVGNRGFEWAQIDIPGDKDLWAVSVHLLTSSSGNRQAEAVSLVAQVKQTVPAADYFVLGGDFNSGTRTEPCITTFSQITRTAGPWPADSNGKDGTSASRSKPHDWVLADPDLDALGIPVQIGNLSFPNGLVFDSRTYPNLADVAPITATDSASANMQHMAVVRDFALPN